MGYLYIAGTIIFTVYGQLILKWRIVKFGELPDQFIDKIIFLLNVFTDPYILSGTMAAVIATFFWMAAMTKFEISYAYPFMSGSFVLVLIFSVLLFNETLSMHKVIGLLFIIFGIFISSRSL